MSIAVGIPELQHLEFGRVLPDWLQLAQAGLVRRRKHAYTKCMSLTYEPAWEPLLQRRRGGRGRAKREQLKRFSGLLPESQGQNLAVAAFHVPDSLDCGASSEGPYHPKTKHSAKGAHRLLYHSTLGLRVIKKERRAVRSSIPQSFTRTVRPQHPCMAHLRQSRHI